MANTFPKADCRDRQKRVESWHCVSEAAIRSIQGWLIAQIWIAASLTREIQD